MTRLLLHIGRPKTGTTALQTFLAANAEPLRKHAYHYVTSSGEVHCNPVFRDLSANRLKNADNKDIGLRILRAREFLESAMPPRGAAVISSEAISNIPAPVLKDMLLGLDCRLAVYVRNELDFLASSYAQYIQANWVDWSIHDYLTDARLKRLSNRNFFEKLDQGGSTEYLAGYYSGRSLFEADVRKDFLKRHLQLDPDPAFEFDTGNASVNVSISDQVVEFKRWLVRQGYDRYRTREGYLALSELSASYGHRFRLPVALRETLLDVLRPNYPGWRHRFEETRETCVYDSYDFSAEETGTMDCGRMLESLDEIIHRSS